MQPHLRFVFTLGVAGFAAACGGAEPTGPLEDFATIPAPPTSTAMQFELTEQVIRPGGDKQICHYLDFTTEEIFVKSFDSFQGKFGHHLILFKARITEEPGTVRDCSNPEDMLRLTPVISSIQFGLREFPEGMAIRVAAGSQLVLQQHYVNTSERDIIVRDGAYLVPVPQSEVQVQAGFFGISDIEFSLPSQEESQTVEFECTVPHDMGLLLAGPHMHEWGQTFRTEMGPRDALQTVIDVTKWEASMRDEPPVTNWSQAAPFELHEGDVMRTRCTFKNTTGHALAFPEEMCATYGYFFPAPRNGEEFTCAGRRL